MNEAFLISKVHKLTVLQIWPSLIHSYHNGQIFLLICRQPLILGTQALAHKRNWVVSLLQYWTNAFVAGVSFNRQSLGEIR